MDVQNNAKGMWSWHDSTAGKALVAFYSSYDPFSKVGFHFESAKYGEIETDLTDVPLVKVEKFPLQYINADEWLRPTTFQEGSLFPDTNYTLTRVIRGDGTAHPTYWDMFLEHMSSGRWFGEGLP